MTEHIVTALNGVGAPNGHAQANPPTAEETWGPDAAGREARDGPTPGIAALKRDPLFRAAVRREVEETTLSYAAIARRFGLSRGSLRRYAVARGWQRPQGAPVATQRRPATGHRLVCSIADGDAVTVRLLRAVDRQIGNLDLRLRKSGTVIDEKDARLLVHLAKTLQTIMALGRDGGAGTKEPADRDDMDADLARRIALWAEGREEA